MPWYIVFRGRKPGVYRDWQTCNQQVSVYSNCLYRGYASEEEAVADYISYFATGGVPTTQSEQYQEILAAAAPMHVAGPAPVHLDPGAPPQAGGLHVLHQEPVRGSPDLFPVVLILVGVVLALLGYIMN